MKLQAFIATLLLCFMVLTGNGQDRQIYQADPTIFYYKRVYYLYGTGADAGFRVYTSPNLEHWTDKGLALKKGDAFGSKGFWAPQVFKHKKKFYMAYVADENIAIAESDSPLGPFVQTDKKPIAAPVKLIDPFIYFEGDKIYLYHVRLDQGNRIFVAEMTTDLSSIKEETLKECINATQPWEDTTNAAWKVTEGPTVVKIKGLYYLLYSANDFRNPDYAVGYATSSTPVGPWKKFTANPVISRAQTGQNGSGHGDLFVDRKGVLRYVFHTHKSNQNSRGNRQTAICSVQFEKNAKGEAVLKLIDNTFRFLNTSE